MRYDRIDCDSDYKYQLFANCAKTSLFSILHLFMCRIELHDIMDTNFDLNYSSFVYKLGN